MIERYLELRKSIRFMELDLKNSIDEGKEKVSYYENSLKEFNDSLSKGNGFSQILISEYTENLKTLNSELLLTFSKKKGLLEKSKKELKELIKKNPELQIFEYYEIISSVEDFKKSLVSLTKGHRTGVLSNEILEKAKRESLKFKELILKDKKYMVKDNRTNYSDMIIFNQDNKILFVKRNKDDDFEPGKYALPGGHVEPAENPMLSAIREVEEELSLTINPKTVSAVGVYEDTKVVINYFCTKINDSLVNMVLEERELQQYEWIELEDISKLDLLMNLKDNFENVIDIPVTVLNSLPGSKEIAAFYGLTEENIPGSGYPI